MNTMMKSYDIDGRIYDCYFYNNGGGDEGVAVFNSTGELLFKFNERVDGEEIVFLLKGYRLNPLKQGVIGID